MSVCMYVACACTDNGSKRLGIDANDESIQSISVQFIGVIRENVLKIAGNLGEKEDPDDMSLVT